MQTSRITPRAVALIAATVVSSCVLFTGCKEGRENVTFIPIAASTAGTGGCNSTMQSIVAPQLVGNVMAALVGPMSRLAASQGGELVYLTAADGSIQELDFTLDPLMPAVTEVASAADLDMTLDLFFPVHPPGILSGVAVLDAKTLVVVEHVSNTILSVDLDAAMNPYGVLGFPSQTPGLVDGSATVARFSFDDGTPTQVVATGDGRLFVADSGNHAVREIELGTDPVVRRAAGFGVPLHADGDVLVSGFDTPTGLVVSCAGELLVTEVGPEGHRLRNVRLGPSNFFGGSSGTVGTLAGDGTNATADGVDESSSLSAPSSPVSSVNGGVAWIDGGTGILRYYDFATGSTDCPRFADCATAVGAGGSFSGAGNYSVVITLSGRFYVLDSGAQALYLVSN